MPLGSTGTPAIISTSEAKNHAGWEVSDVEVTNYHGGPGCQSLRHAHNAASERSVSGRLTAFSSLPFTILPGKLRLALVSAVSL